MSTTMGVQALPQLELFALANGTGAAIAAPSVAVREHAAQVTVLDETDAGEPAAPQLGLPLPACPLNDVDWSENEIYGLLERMLVDQLRALNDDRTSAEMRRELIAWVAKPLRQSRAAVRDDPFSFQSCCYAAGLDPEELQEQVLFMFAPERLA